MTTATADAAATELVITRSFDATPEQVFDAWCSPKLAKWIGPGKVRAEVEMMEARVGGRYRIKMNTPDGATPMVGGVYREITRPTRLAFTWTWEHEKHEMLITLSFRAVGKKTEMTLHQQNIASAERRDNHKQGWGGSFDKLAEFLAG